MANSLAVVLIDRVPSVAARASAPTWSTPGSPCRNRRNDAFDEVASARSAGTPYELAVEFMAVLTGQA